MKIAVCADQGANQRSGWSGTPFNFLHGLGEAGVETVSIDTLPPPPVQKMICLLIAFTQVGRFSGNSFPERLRNSFISAKNHTFFLGVCSLVASMRVRKAGKVDAVLQMGTHFLVRHPNVFSYEDMTVVQAISLPHTHLHSLSSKQQNRRITRQLNSYRRMSGLFYSTEWPALSAVNDYGVSHEKVHVIGIGRNYSPPQTQKNWETPHFLFIGKNFEQKGGPATLKAFAEVKKLIPQAKLAIVGNHPDITEPGVTGYGHLSLGNQKHAQTIEELWSKATCLVVPAVHESAGIVFAEAASAGIPSIGSAIGGAKYIIGEGGCVVNPFDQVELVNAMMALSNPLNAQQIGAINHAHSYLHEWPLIIENLLSIVKKQISQQKQR